MMFYKNYLENLFKCDVCRHIEARRKFFLRLLKYLVNKKVLKENLIQMNDTISSFCHICIQSNGAASETQIAKSSRQPLQPRFLPYASSLVNIKKAATLAISRCCAGRPSMSREIMLCFWSSIKPPNNISAALCAWPGTKALHRNSLVGEIPGHCFGEADNAGLGSDVTVVL